MGKSSFDINLNININVNLDKVLELMNAASAAWNAMQGTRGEAAPEPEQAAGQEPEQGQGQEQELGQELGQEQPAEAPTEQDLRDAIRRTRARIEGEDYENNTDSEGYAR